MAKQHSSHHQRGFWSPGSILFIAAMLAVCLVGVMIFMTIEQTNQIVQQGPVMDATLGTLAEQQKIR